MAEENWWQCTWGTLVEELKNYRWSYPTVDDAGWLEVCRAVWDTRDKKCDLVSMYEIPAVMKKAVKNYRRKKMIDGLTGYMVFPSQSAVADALKIRREAFQTDDGWLAAVDGVWSICERNEDGLYVAPVEEAESAIAEALSEEEAMLDHYREVGVYEAIQQARWDAAEFSRGDD